MRACTRNILSAAAALIAAAATAYAQTPDTSGIYRDRTDSLQATVFQSRQSGNYLSKGSDIRAEVISSAGLRKLACCSLADSFENSASVTVGYSDAVTGARQIRLLGLDGSYTQMLDETRPVMRGLASPFGLSYIPGAWMESIQIAKGATSVVSGSEAFTGAINVEHRKPTDEKPLYIEGSVMSDTKADLSLVSSLQLGEKWSTVVMADATGNFEAMDSNGDGFVDAPKQRQIALDNRWLYFAPSGAAVRFGVKALADDRQGGQLMSRTATAWTSDISNRSVGAYFKAGKPVHEDRGSIAAVLNYNLHSMDASFGASAYDALQHSAYLNLLWQEDFSERHKITAGVSGTADFYDESLSKECGLLVGGMPFFVTYSFDGRTNLASGGPFAEYTFHDGEKFTAVLGLRGDWYLGEGLKAVPRATIRWSPTEKLVLRANGGRAMRYATPVTDHIGLMSTAKFVDGRLDDHILEDAWTYGGNLTCYFGDSSSQYFGIEYFHNTFSEQAVIDYGAYTASLYRLSEVTDGRSFTDNLQADLALEPFERFTVSLTGRYTLAKTSYKDVGLTEKPMTSRYKAVLGLQYATNLRKWIFDATASLNGPCRVWSFMEGLADADGNLLYRDGKTPVYPLLYFQITRRMKGWDFYIGGENLSGFRQKSVIISDPSSIYFDASQVWGPVMGAMVYAGFRFTLWKTT